MNKKKTNPAGERKGIPVVNEICQRLRHLRTDCHPEISIEDMAKSADVSPERWIEYERDGVIPPSKVFQKLQLAKFDISYVLTGQHMNTMDLYADEWMLLKAYRKLETDAKNALCNLASSCLTADEIRKNHPLTQKKNEMAVIQHLHFNEAVGVFVHHNIGVINSKV